MGYDRGDNFSFDFEPNGIPFGSENLKENCHHDQIPFNVKGNGSLVFSVHVADRIYFHSLVQLALTAKAHWLQVLQFNFTILPLSHGCYGKNVHIANIIYFHYSNYSSL